jgi:hypothetical protein
LWQTVQGLRKDLTAMQMLFDAEVDQLNSQIAEKTEGSTYFYFRQQSFAIWLTS